MENEFDNSDATRTDAASKAQQARERAAAAANRTADKVGNQMRSFAGRLREGGPRVESRIHDTTTRLADSLDRGADYFTEHRYEETTRKITDSIRRNPGRSLLIGLAVGALLAIKRRF